MHIQENIALAPLTTFGIGGPARWFVEAQIEPDVAAATEWAREKGVPLFVLGGGSNLLVADEGFEGLVLHVVNKGITVGNSSPKSNERSFLVAAGEDWDAFVQRTVDEGCAGIECLAGIPGTAGGTPVQNVGAYGQEVANTIVRVCAFDLRHHSFVSFDNAQCQFGYRRSRFNGSDRGRYIVTAVEYSLDLGGAPCLRYGDLKREFEGNSQPSLPEVAETVRNIRRSKGMFIEDGNPNGRSAGSFFKNPVVTKEQRVYVAQAAGSEPPSFPAGDDRLECVKLPAGWLIERAGYSKGYALGRAAISTKHTLAIVNLGGASASEIIALADRIRSSVFERFAIDLETEPVMLGF